MTSELCECETPLVYMRIGNAIRQHCPKCDIWTGPTEEIKTQEDQDVLEAAIKFAKSYHWGNNWDEFLAVVEKHSKFKDKP